MAIKNLTISEKNWMALGIKKGKTNKEVEKDVMELRRELKTQAALIKKKFPGYKA